jgi:hypothetical protein
LKNLARFMATCKHIKSEVLAAITHDAKQLMQDALRPFSAAAAAEAAEAEATVKFSLRRSTIPTHFKAVLWMLHVTPEAAYAALTAADTAERLMQVPAVPLEAAVKLVAAGAHIHYAHLLAAADSMVAGVEVWVQALQHLQGKTDVPACAAAICCGDLVSGCASYLCLKGVLLVSPAKPQPQLISMRRVVSTGVACHAIRCKAVCVPLTCLPAALSCLQRGRDLAQQLAGLPAATAACLRQLAMNCSSHATAAAAAYQLPPMKPSQARKLVVTAAARQHAQVVVHLLKLQRSCRMLMS